VHVAPLVDCGDLDPGHVRQAELRGRAADIGDGRRGVVVGNGQHADAGHPRLANQVGR
jgi:hypothetical protein